MHEGFQLNAVPHVGMNGSHSVQAYLPGKNHPGTPQVTIMRHCIAVHRAGLGADVHRQPRQFFPQAGNGTQVADDHSIHAAGHGHTSPCHKGVHLIIKGKYIHGEVEFLACLMGLRHGSLQLLFIEISCKGTETKTLHAAIHRICTKVKGRRKRFHAAGRAKQFHIIQSPSIHHKPSTKVHKWPQPDHAPPGSWRSRAPRFPDPWRRSTDNSPQRRFHPDTKLH